MGCTCTSKSEKSTRTLPSERNITKQMSTNTRAILKELDGIPKQYSFKKLLGSGKFGRVLLWESEKKKHKFAVKAIIKGDFPFSRMVEEINILAKVDHPNIVKYIRSFQSKKYLYVITEYCPGDNLFRKIVSQGKFGEPEARTVMQEILRAINHCHHLGIIHRDLKPENIMYSDNGILKIIDFGLSMKENTFSLERLAGTRHYIAPEVIREGKYTKACDIWSLGVILHVLLSGYFPIGGANAEQIFAATVAFKEPSFKMEVWNGVSAAAKDLVKKMMNPDCETRITAAAALEHPWFNMKKEELPPAIPEILKSLHDYGQASKIKRKILNMLVKGLSSKDLAGFNEAFTALDKNHTGLITCKEIEDYLRGVGYTATAEEFENYTRRINKDGEAYINYSEFISAAMATKEFLTEEKLGEMFKVLDINDKGVISTNMISGKMKDNKFQIVDPKGTTDKVETDLYEQITFEQFKCILLT
eukprot:TRINITY_DN1902_c0_g1_i7.p1 TRINITY_DN1902_c0_g1~~TRINITY_DN1902_c0_g1_i7.p1  ORF type:complete len:475 (-),score=129.55 TRINITY_DN1902_c0_g1_i7:141-1565(-)